MTPFIQETCFAVEKIGIDKSSKKAAKVKKIKKADLDAVKQQFIDAGYTEQQVEDAFGSDEKKYYDVDLADAIRRLLNADTN